MLFDTDVLIWALRGHTGAAQIIENESARRVSIVTYMEILQGVRDRRELQQIKSLLADLDFLIIPLDENTGLRASIYMEEYCLKAGMCMGDALVAAAAVENQQVLCTANKRHYKDIVDLQLKIFKPQPE